MLNCIVVWVRFILLAPAFQTILVGIIPIETTGPSADWFGDPQADPHHGDRESHLGCASSTRRAEKTGISDFGTDCIALDAEEKREAVADVDDVSSKSRRPNGLGRLLHGSDHPASGVVCLFHPGARPAAGCAFQRDRTSYSRLD